MFNVFSPFSAFIYIFFLPLLFNILSKSGATEAACKSFLLPTPLNTQQLKSLKPSNKTKSQRDQTAQYHSRHHKGHCLSRMKAQSNARRNSNNNNSKICLLMFPMLEECNNLLSKLNNYNTWPGHSSSSINTPFINTFSHLLIESSYAAHFLFVQQHSCAQKKKKTHPLLYKILSM